MEKVSSFFLSGLKVNLTNIMDAFIYYISSIKETEQKNNTVREKRQRRSLVTDYSKEVIIGTVQPSSKKNIQKNNRSHNKTQKLLKDKTYGEEKEWNLTFYDDLEKQLTIKDIKYVDTSKTTEFYLELINYFEEKN